jgi:hypothetical protein
MYAFASSYLGYDLVFIQKSEIIKCSLNGKISEDEQAKTSNFDDQFIKENNNALRSV